MKQISKNDEKAAWLSRWVGKGLGRVGGAPALPLGGRRASASEIRRGKGRVPAGSRFL